MIRRKNESDYDSYFNDYTYDTVPDVPSIGGIPQYNPMIVEDRIELMKDVKNILGDYWFSEDPKIEDEVCRWTKDGSCLYVRDISWDLEHPDEVFVSFGLSGYDKDNKYFDKFVEERSIDIDFENFLGHDVEGSLVKFLNKKIFSLLDAVFHGGLKKEDRNMIRRKRVNESKHTDFLMKFVRVWNRKKSPRLEIMSDDTAVGRGDDKMFVAELYEDCVRMSRYSLDAEDDYCAEDLDTL